VIEAAARPGEPALLPMTLRHVQAELSGAGGTGGALRTLHLGPATPDATLLQWIARLQRDHDDAWRTRAQPLLSREAAARAQPLPARREGDTRATEVVGIPLPARGLHVVEAESRLLGAALLEPPVPMHARTAALVTNLGVHFKRGRSSSLVWVTALDRARPVPGAQVTVNDCHGQPLWSGRTDAQGLARIPRGFDEPREAGDEAEPRAAGAPQPRRCTSRDGLFVTARATLDGQAELGLVFSRWHRGIEPWRFGIATAEGTVPDRRAHTVFSRTLLRTGEALHMKHFVRDETERGLARVPVAELPDEVVITHLGSDTVTRLPLPAAAWAGGRAAESSWTVPATAPLGLYDVALQRGQRRWGSGSFRVEAFRVPLVDARLSGPAADVVAPAELAFDGRLAAMAGGPLRDVPATLSALLRPRSPAFAGLEDFVFEPPRRAPQADDDEPADPARVVARQLPARTGADGRARFAVPGLPPLDGPAELQVELGFADLNGETQTVSRRWRLWPAAVVVGLRVPGWASVKNELQATAVVVDTADRPLAGRELVLQGRQHRVLSTRTRLVGGFYAYDNRREVQELGELCRGRSDARGRLRQAWGEPFVVDTLTVAGGAVASVDVRHHVRAFFQGNRYLLQALVDDVVSRVSAPVVADLYAGVGLFSLVLAAQGRAVEAVEGDDWAAGDLQANGGPTSRVHVHHRAVEAYVQRTRLDAFGTVVVDPPRPGLAPEVTTALVGARVPRVVYVSCDPATLARDVRLFVDGGYAVRDVHAFDLFPRTAHVETVLTLTR
jgi:hypothetical protein